MHIPAKSDHLLTTAEAARWLGLATGTLQNWRHRGQGPAWVRLGRAVRYTADSLATYVQHQRVLPKPSPAEIELREVEADLSALASALRGYNSFNDAPADIVSWYAQLCHRRSELLGAVGDWAHESC